MRLENKKYRIEDILKTDTAFLVRAYQRQYEPTEQWLNSIIYEECKQGLSTLSATTSSHNGTYLLSCLLKRVLANGEEYLSIVDGQQRITTWLIGLVALAVKWNLVGATLERCENFTRLLTMFLKNFKYELRNRDIKLAELLKTKLEDSNAEIKNDYVKKTYSKWMKCFKELENEGLNNVDICDYMLNTTISLVLLEETDNEQDFFVKANKIKNAMPLYALTSPCFFVNRSQDDTRTGEAYAQDYDDFTYKNMNKVDTNQFTVYWLDHMIRTAVSVKYKIPFPKVKESTVQGIAASITALTKDKKGNLLNICQEYERYLNYIKNPEYVDSESFRPVMRAMLASRVMANGNNPKRKSDGNTETWPLFITSVDAVIVKAFYLQKNNGSIPVENLEEFFTALLEYLVRKYMLVGGMSDHFSATFDKIFIKTNELEGVLLSDSPKTKFFSILSKNGLVYGTDEMFAARLKGTEEDLEAGKVVNKLKNICSAMHVMYPDDEDFMSETTFAKQCVDTIDYRGEECFLQTALLDKFSSTGAC